MKTKLAFIIIIFSLAGCVPKPPKFSKELFKGTEGIEYFRLNNPTSDIPLPAFFNGDQNSLDGVCLKEVPRTETNGAAIFTRFQQAKSDFEASLKVDFENAAVKAGLSTALAQAFSQTLKTELTDLKQVSVSPALIFPNFNILNCNESSLKWFTDQRKVVTGGLKAGTVNISVGNQASSVSSLQLDAIIEKLNTDLKIALKRVAEAGGSFNITGNDLFVGAFTNSLAVIKCTQLFPELNFKESQEMALKFCDEYTVRLKKSAFPDVSRMTFQLSHKDGATTSDVDVALGQQVLIKNIENRIIVLTINKPASDGKFDLDISVTLVGVTGEQTN